MWDGGSPRTIPTDDVEDWWGPQLLGNDGTVIGACTVVRCFYLLPPGSTELQPFPKTLDVAEDDGTTSTYAVVIVQDTNVHGQLLVIGEPVGTDDRVVLLMTPAE